MGSGRIVLHLDMDAFYAAVETLHRPELRGIPVVIGADPKGGAGRGVVSTANYEARKHGIGSAMPISQAYRACPDAVFLRPSFHLYKAASEAVMDVLRTYTDQVQVVGMDEAYLDVTHACRGQWTRASSLCRSLQAAVKRETGLSCSIGAAPNKSAAKIASDFRKPHGITVVPTDELARFMEPLSVRKINGCGPKSAQMLEEYGWKRIGQLASATQLEVDTLLGQRGRWLWDVAQGRDDRPVATSRGPSKSRGNERTYRRDVRDHNRVLADARKLALQLLDSRDKRDVQTFTVKLRYHDFGTLTRSHTLSIPINPRADEARTLAVATVESLLRPLLDDRPVRLVGVRLSGFGKASGQAPLSAFVKKPVTPHVNVA